MTTSDGILTLSDIASGLDAVGGVDGLIEFRDEAHNQSDDYFNYHFPDGTEGERNAFRHAYTSGRFAQAAGSDFAKFLGDAHELGSDILTFGKNRFSDGDDRRADRWNNRGGIEDAEGTNTPAELAQAIADAMKNTDDYITDPEEDDRDIEDEPEIPEDALNALEELPPELAVSPEEEPYVLSYLPSPFDFPLTSVLVPALELWSETSNTVSPLVLDMDGDGIELVNIDDAEQYFDLDQDSFAEITGWVDPDDGLLAIDTNEDGVINNITELFGNKTTDGFTILIDYDSNGDGIINSDDAQWSDLLVWQDENGNGYSESSELYTLDDVGILSISLSGVTEVDYEIEDNHISHESTFTIDTGGGVVTNDIVDAWFAVDDLNTVYIGEYSLDVRAAYLPQLRGFGELPSLSISISLDNNDTGNLLDLVKSLKYTDLEDLFTSTTDNLILDILYRWAGVDDVDPEGRGEHFDGQKLGFMEALFGDNYLQSGHWPNPTGRNAGALLNDAWDLLYGAFKAHLLSQTEAKELFEDGAIVYNTVTGILEGDLDLNETFITTTLSDAADGEEFWRSVADFLQFIKDPTTEERGWLDQAVADSGVGGLSDWSDVEALLDPIIGEDWTGTSGADAHAGTSFKDLQKCFGCTDELRFIKIQPGTRFLIL